jgi:hypothetical protein
LASRSRARKRKSAKKRRRPPLQIQHLKNAFYLTKWPIFKNLQYFTLRVLLKPGILAENSTAMLGLPPATAIIPLWSNHVCINVLSWIINYSILFYSILSHPHVTLTLFPMISRKLKMAETAENGWHC